MLRTTIACTVLFDLVSACKCRPEPNSDSTPPGASLVVDSYDRDGLYQTG